MTYAEHRRLLLIEMRLMRLTKPAQRVVKHQQRLMKVLRLVRRDGIVK